MKINIHIRGSLAEIGAEIGNAISFETLSYTNDGVIDQTIIEQLITAANTASRFNKQSDVDFVELVATMFLDDVEHEQLIKRLSL